MRAAVDAALLAGAEVGARLPEAVRRRLAERGAEPDPQPAEPAEAFHDRLDTELMVLFQSSGSGEDFELLYRHARGRVFAWLRWLAGQQGARIDPLDLLQDTFVNVFRYGHAFQRRHDASFRSWVRTIAGNALRRAQVRSPRWSLQALPDGVNEPVDSGPGPQLRLVAGEDRAQLHGAWLIFLQHYARAFDSLSPRDRRALELVELEGHTYAETGAILGVGPSNMKMIMLRARRRLQARMRLAMGADEDRPLVRSRPRTARRLAAC
jgi:RNA polymerase sigma factor (sigma-70 family)